MHTVPCEGRDVRDDPLLTEQDLRQVLIDMIPIPGQAHAEGGHLMRNLLAEFLRGFSLRTLIFLLDMVLPQLDAYHAGRQLQHLQPWISVELAQQQARGQQGVELAVIMCCCCICKSSSSKHFHRKVRGTVMVVADWQKSVSTGEKPGRVASSS